MRLLVTLVLLTNSVGASGATTPIAPTASGEHIEHIIGSYLSYPVVVGGALDMDNTTTMAFDDVSIVFQNNESLTVANTGEVTVRNPRVVANDQGRWWSLESLLTEILAGASNDQEKAFYIYDFLRRNRYHDYPLFTGDELHDPVRLLNEFGAGFCDDAAFVGCSLFYHAGLNRAKYGLDPRVRTLKGHMMCEAVVEGDYQFLDIDQQTFYLDLENERPVSGDAVARDHYLAKREQVFGPRFVNWSVGENAAAFFGRDDGATFRAIAEHRIEYSLRPGERIVLRWDNIGKIPIGVDRSKMRRRYWGNSLWVYEPRLTAERLAADAVAHSTRHCVFEMAAPYALCGGRVKAVFNGAKSTDEFVVSVSVDSLVWKEVWHGSGSGQVVCDVDLDEHLRRGASAPRYRYFVRVDAPLTAIADLRCESDLMVSPLSLPRLRVGSNAIIYTDETPGPHAITIEHRWRECTTVSRPPPPEQPDSPAPYTIVFTPTIPFRWPGVAGADLYHLQVSRHPDMRLAYRPCFDVQVETNEHHAPFPGLFNPDEDYFWRVRARNAAGAWGDWSEVWSFRWEGPRVPVDLVAAIEGVEIAISWQPNPLGPPPAHYEVYGSDERGFTPSKTAHEVPGLGVQPSNFLGATKDNCLVVVAEGASLPAMNRSFYRVIAVDRNGVAGGPSAQVELPHPFIFSKPVTVARVGEPYRYQARSLTSRGDLQKRYAQPIFDYWEREGCAYDLVDGPAWLMVEAESGVLSGRPAATDRGVHSVTVVGRRTYPFEQGFDDYRASYFQKGEARFQAEHRQSFELVVE